VIPLQLHNALTISLGQEQLYVPKKALRFHTVWNVQRHCNAEWEFHFIRKGQCLTDIAQTQYTISAGQALLIKPGLYHQAKTLTEEFAHFTLGFLLPQGTVYQQLAETAAARPVFTLSEELCGTIERLWGETGRNAPYSDAYTDALIQCLIVELLRFLGIDSTAAQPQPHTTEEQLTQTIDTFFEQHFAEACGEEMLAQKLHFSRRHLVRILKKYYGMSFREKLVTTRMDYAAFLLRTTDQPVGQIGADVGYDSESAFFKVFRRSFGMTPRQYRIKHK
jgi:AraC-like DNA-binding protein